MWIEGELRWFVTWQINTMVLLEILTERLIHPTRVETVLRPCEGYKNRLIGVMIKRRLAYGSFRLYWNVAALASEKSSNGADC